MRLRDGTACSLCGCDWSRRAGEGDRRVCVDVVSCTKRVRDSIVSRHDFPLPENAPALRCRILVLFSDGISRSVREIKNALGTDSVVDARIRDLRKPQFGSWPFVDVRRKGPDADDVYRHQMIICDLTRDQRAILRSLGAKVAM